MKELLEYIAKALVENPDEVEVIQEEEEEGKIVLKLKVADEDKGRIIGKRGRIAESIRAILRVKAVKTEKHVFLDIV
ncbi:MAG: RNA-binding protein [Chloroflexi bacterium]|nr:RNA-binding protein [Chloroflexota bacterium]